MTSDTTHHQGAILVVDDEAPIGELLQQWLADEGYRTVYVPSFEAVRAALAQQAYDLVTLDIMMPDASGLEILPWIRQHYPDTGVIMATALGDLNTVLEAMRLGAINYLLKPFNMELVSEQVARAMERQRLIAENRSYQQELQQKVEAQTRQIRLAHAQLERRVRELEGRDRLVHFQMSGPTQETACAETLGVITEVLDVGASVLYRPGLNGAGLLPAAARGVTRLGEVEEAEELARLPSIALVADADEPSTDARQESPDSLRQSVDIVRRAYADRQLRESADGQIAVPILYRDEAMGVVWIDNLGDPSRDEALETLMRLAREAAVLLWSARVAADLDSGQLEVDRLLEME